MSEPLSATIQQLMPMPDRWEFQYMFHNPGDGSKLLRSKILGLAVVKYPLGEEALQDSEQRVVYFGEPTVGSCMQFEFFNTYGWLHEIYPFFSNGPQSRGLGIAPAGSPDDYFGEDVGEAREQLAADWNHNSDYHRFARLFKDIDEHYGAFYEGLDNLFAITTGKFRYEASEAEWTKVVDELDKLQRERGDSSVIKAVLDARALSRQQVCDLMFEDMPRRRRAA
jgi:hypothetical protein